MEAPEEDVRPVELPLFRAAVEVLRIRMFEVEADQTDARGAEMVCEEHRPISIRKAAEVPQASEGPGLRRRHRCPGEPRCPLPHRRSVVAVAVDDRCRPFGLRRVWTRD